MSTVSATSKDPKRRRTIKADVASSETKRSKVSILDSHQAKSRSSAHHFHAEEEEAASRDPIKDVDLYKHTCKEVSKTFAEICELKKTEGKEDAVTNKRIHGSLQFIALRKLNRLSHLRCKKVRDATNEAKQKIDLYHLQLQNLLYEAMHLEKEITKCLEFKSKDEEIELVDVDTFYKEAPKEISKPAITKKDTHIQTLARLDWELEQRKKLAQKLKDTQDSKEVISIDIKSKQEYLESLQPKLNAILEASTPVQDYLGLPFDKIQEQHKTAHFLPAPLYVLYMQSSGYKEACDKKLSVTIEGSLNDAKAFHDAPSDAEDESDSDQEESEKKRKHRRRTTTTDKVSDKKMKLLRKHPLSVLMKLEFKDGIVLNLRYFYLTSLHIVAVKACMAMEKNTVGSVVGGDLLQPDILLECLYPGDRGEETPNPANRFQMKRIGIESFQSEIETAGRPYIWAQWLAGLQFLSNVTEVKAQSSVSSSRMDEIIKQLRRRVQTKMVLQKHISAIENGTISVSKQYQKLFPVKIHSKVTSWTRETFLEYKMLPQTKSLIDTGMVEERDMFFTAMIERGSARLKADIVLSPDYPYQSPIFALSLEWQSQRNNTNDENIRAMEAEVNLHYDELMPGGKPHAELLTNQLQRLCMCLDIFLESESSYSTTAPVEFSKEKMMPRIGRGPGRAKALRFIPQMGFFAQR
ncbi:THO complex subunit 5 homolog isoform X2 [Lineus longissimus]|uniref:THO complex subunit 5 homolog isoform X2 n=1 Tax=Lineus longissimus TaxID=88925 RepID=UPI00315D6542